MCQTADYYMSISELIEQHIGFMYYNIYIIYMYTTTSASCRGVRAFENYSKNRIQQLIAGCTRTETPIRTCPCASDGTAYEKRLTVCWRTPARSSARFTPVRFQVRSWENHTLTGLRPQHVTDAKKVKMVRNRRQTCQGVAQFSSVAFIPTVQL